MLVAETFKALGDPIRLEMIKRLADGSHYNVSGLSEGLGLTRQGARKHIQVLAKVQLVSLQTVGRQIEVRLDPESLSVAKSFISDLVLLWDQRLQALREFVESGSLED